MKKDIVKTWYKGINSGIIYQGALTNHLYSGESPLIYSKMHTIIILVVLFLFLLYVFSPD